MEPVYTEDYKGYRIKLFPEEDMGDPRTNMDFACSLVFEKKGHWLSYDDDYAGDEGPLFEILSRINPDYADRLLYIFRCKDDRLDYSYSWGIHETHKDKEYKHDKGLLEDWFIGWIGRKLDKLGVVYDDFSLRGPDHHRGVAYISAKKIQEEWKSDKGMALKCIRSEIETLNQWIEGDVYYRTITKLVDPPLDSDDDEPIEGEEVDAVGGFYGYKYAMEDARETVDALIKTEMANQPALRVARELNLI